MEKKSSVMSKKSNKPVSSTPLKDSLYIPKEKYEKITTGVSVSVIIFFLLIFMICGMDVFAAICFDFIITIIALGVAIFLNMKHDVKIEERKSYYTNSQIFYTACVELELSPPFTDKQISIILQQANNPSFIKPNYNTIYNEGCAFYTELISLEDPENHQIFKEYLDIPYDRKYSDGILKHYENQVERSKRGYNSRLSDAINDKYYQPDYHRPISVADAIVGVRNEIRAAEIRKQGEKQFEFVQNTDSKYKNSYNALLKAVDKFCGFTSPITEFSEDKVSCSNIELRESGAIQAVFKYSARNKAYHLIDGVIDVKVYQDGKEVGDGTWYTAGYYSKYLREPAEAVEELGLNKPATVLFMPYPGYFFDTAKPFTFTYSATLWQIDKNDFLSKYQEVYKAERELRNRYHF